MRPSFEDPPFQYLAEASPSCGMKVMLPQSSRHCPSFKFALMIHDFLPTQSREVKLKILRAVIYDLVQVKQMGAIFITDIEIEKKDIYADWSSFWPEFIKIIAEACCGYNYTK